jgi:hypothetical protein
MSKALDTTTTNVVALAPRPRTPVDTPSEIEVAHNKLMALLAGNRPPAIHGPMAHRFDLMRRRDHLYAVLKPVLDYTRTIVQDTRDLAPMGYIADETGFLEDSISTIYGAIDEAINRLIEERDEA